MQFSSLSRKSSITIDYCHFFQNRISFAVRSSYTGFASVHARFYGVLKIPLLRTCPEPPALTLEQCVVHATSILLKSKKGFRVFASSSVDEKNWTGEVANSRYSETMARAIFDERVLQEMRWTPAPTGWRNLSHVIIIYTSKNTRSNDFVRSISFVTEYDLFQKTSGPRRTPCILRIAAAWPWGEETPKRAGREKLTAEQRVKKSKPSSGVRSMRSVSIVAKYSRFVCGKKKKKTLYK